MKPIPIEAMPVVEVLRRDVPRPKELPVLIEIGTGKALRWGVCICPMGLHKKSSSYTPTCPLDFTGDECLNEAICAFYEWWDSLTLADAPAAMDAIWLVAA